MDKYNSQLPQVKIAPPLPPRMFSMRLVWGYIFLAVSFLLAVSFIYQVQYKRTPTESRVCIQVVTPAKNPETGEIRDFPTPCDVPEGWEPIRQEILPMTESQN